MLLIFGIFHKHRWEINDKNIRYISTQSNTWSCLGATTQMKGKNQHFSHNKHFIRLKQKKNLHVCN